MQNTGKLLILSILTVAILLAAASWWFRYEGTRRSVALWGPEGAQLIRDAPDVRFVRGEAQHAANGDGRYKELSRDVSTARGLLHLRNALLEDRSFDWSNSGGPGDDIWTDRLEFRRSANDDEPAYVVLLSPDCEWVRGRASRDGTSPIVSSRPIAKGLAEVFAEFVANEQPVAR